MFDFHSSEKEVRTRLLTKLEQDQKITLQSLTEECQCILNLIADTAKVEERDISNIHTIKNHKVRKINHLAKLIRVTGVENCIYLKTVHLNTKKCHTCRRKGHKFSHCRLGGGNYSKNKKQVQFTTEQATTEKVQRKYINICLNKKNKIKFQIDTGSDLTIINAET